MVLSEIERRCEISLSIASLTLPISSNKCEMQNSPVLHARGDENTKKGEREIKRKIRSLGDEIS